MLIDAASQMAGDGALSPASSRGAGRYALQPGLTLVPLPADDAAERPPGGVLMSMRPLMAIRLNRGGFDLLSILLTGVHSAAEAARATGTSPREAAAFFDRLVHRRLLLRVPPPPVRWPLVSIIVAAHGRHESTRACVQSLLALDDPSERREIIVVDDASEPPLAPALAGLPIRLIRLDRNLGQSAARNLAATEAEGEVLAFIDNDCIAASDWLATLVPHLVDPSVAIVGGRVIAPPSTGPIAAFEAVRSPLDMGSMAGPVGPDEAVAYLPTCNFLIRRDAFLAVGGFTPELRLGEDVDLTWRVLSTGASAVYAPEGRVTHHHRDRLRALLRRRADYGSSEAELQCRHPSAHRVLPMPRLCLLALMALTTAMIAWPVGLALAGAVSALFTGEVLGKRRQIGRLGVALPVTRVGTAVAREHFASLHGLSANLIRYYGLPLALAGAVTPVLLPAVVVLALFAPLIDHMRLRPACGRAAFVGLYWLEMAAYQAGVWRGCFARRAFHPLLPIVNWRR